MALSWHVAEVFKHTAFCFLCTLYRAAVKGDIRIFFQNYTIAVKSYSKGFVKTINTDILKYAKIFLHKNNK